MSSIYTKVQKGLLIEDLKKARKKHGKDSDQVFKIIKSLKSMDMCKSDVDEWVEHTLYCGSFGGRWNN